MTDSQETPTLRTSAQVEALLFTAPEPVTAGQLAAALDLTAGQVEKAIAELEAALSGRGIRLQRFGSRMQLTSAPEAGEVVERFLGLEITSKLSGAAVEALAIIAYEQPATRPQIDAIRGVNSDYVLRSLLRKGLIEEVGRSDGVGRPILYGVTVEFLHHFGLNSLDELPPLISPPASEPEITDINRI